MSGRWILGTFDDEAHLLAATHAARAEAYHIHDVYTPYAVHGLPEAMGLRASRLTWVCFLLGALGLALAIWFQFWTSSEDWPINVGGKPFNSWPAFVPIAFEITILFAGLGVVAALLIRCGLWPGGRKAQPRIEVTDDRFVLVLRLEGAAHTVDEAFTLLRARGAIEVADHVEEVAS
jgi:hypothetical protein